LKRLRLSNQNHPMANRHLWLFFPRWQGSFGIL
jgi:hypothetical protein